MRNRLFFLVYWSLVFSLYGWGCNSHDPFKNAIYRAQEKQIIQSIKELKSSHYSWTPQNRAKQRHLEAELKQVQSYLKKTTSSL